MVLGLRLGRLQAVADAKGIQHAQTENCQTEPKQVCKAVLKISLLHNTGRACVLESERAHTIYTHALMACSSHKQQGKQFVEVLVCFFTGWQDLPRKRKLLQKVLEFGIMQVPLPSDCCNNNRGISAYIHIYIYRHLNAGILRSIGALHTYIYRYKWCLQVSLRHKHVYKHFYNAQYIEAKAKNRKGLQISKKITNYKYISISQ